ncbi:uncharacterized protein LOC141983008 [Natator depressus]|uniref:uncharacterized protein LOC141983008 n=1 Tax=Natator depressus TaxID=27790 RepID=UPI003EBC0BD5
MQSQNCKRAPAWTEREVLDLIVVWGDKSVLSELRSKRRNAKIFEKISKGMMDRGYNRARQQCHVKIKELRQGYQKNKQANNCSGSEPQTCHIYDELRAILGGAPITTAPLYVNSCKGGVSRNRDEDFGGEDDDDEAEDETILPPGQEVFITLDPIPSQPSQGGLPDLEGGEGTSDESANVSTLPLSSPFQRLAQIRRQKKCTSDEMFSELMQSSRTERAQQNAWRQTSAESRKVANECKERWWEQDDRWRQHDERRQEAMLRLLEDQTDMFWHMVELEERQHEHRPPLQLLCNRPPSSPSSIASSPRGPRMQWGGGGLWAPNHSTPEDCPSNRRLAFNMF